MEKELDPVVIKATQTSLGKYVKRPPLTEKLLKKPPFRFLHDIVTSVLKTTGFFEGLFNEDELISENVKERESKILFLNKVITVVGLATGKSLSVKPSKIVAGQEPEKTNELLQCIAHALDKKLSSDEAVKRFKDGTKPSKTNDKMSKDSLKPSKKPVESNKLTSKSNEKLTREKKDSSSRSSTKNESEKPNTRTKQKERNMQKNESPPKKTTQQTKPIVSKKGSLEKQKSESNDNSIGQGQVKDDSLDNDIDKRKEITLNLNNTDIDSQTRTDINTDLLTHVENSEPHNHNNSYTVADNALNSSLSSQDLMETENIKSQDGNITDDNASSLVIGQGGGTEFNDSHDIDGEDGKKDLIKEPTQIDNVIKSNIDIKTEDKPDGEQLIKKSPIKNKNITRPQSVRPSSSRPGAPRPRDKHDTILIEAENIMVGKVNIIAENAPNEEEEDNSIIIMEQETSAPEVVQDEQDQMQASLNEHGHLVQQILDSQKEYSQMAGKTEIEWQFGAMKARDALNKEMEQLRFDIQALSRVANPLGKLLDHIQEDVEVMRQELHQWTKTYEDTSKELSIQKAANEESLFPLYGKVKQLDLDILEKHDKINDLKIIIHKNSLRIEKLLENGNVQ